MLYRLAGSIVISLSIMAGFSVFHPARANLIAFVSDRDGVDHIYLMNPDGTDVTRLTNNSFQEGYPSWSPDGTKLVFEGYINGVGTYEIDFATRNQIRLSRFVSVDIRPSYSPDGSKIVFSRIESQTSEPFPTSLVTMDIATKKTSTILASQGEYNIEARWSPDGKKILWMSNRTGKQNLFTMNPDGTDIQQITNEGASGDPAWSPDGSRISFGSNLGGRISLNVFTMDPDGSDIFQVTDYHQPFEAGDTSWSVDASQIVYEFDFRGRGQNNPDAFAEVHIINTDGTNDISTGQRCSAVGCAPRWQPDKPLGTHIPEPSTLTILGISLFGLGLMRFVRQT